MDKNEIIKVLQDWNFWEKDINFGIKRNVYLDQLKKFLLSEQVIVITGPRRSGKSFLMRQLACELIKKRINKNRILIINFEDPRFSELNVLLIQKIYNVYLEFLQPKESPYIFLDEIQEVEKWEKWVLMAQDLKKAKIILSGSNAKLLSRELATLLTGRHLDLKVSPLSFKEFLEFNDVSIKNNLDILKEEIKIKSFLKLYIENGSFPEVVLQKNKKEILLTYFEDILEKDLIKRYRIRKTEKFKDLLKFYFSNISCLITFNSLEKSLKISTDSIEKFSFYFESAYLLFFLKRFSFKVKEQEKSPRKVYAIDTGLANTIGFKFSENYGRLAENIVFLKLQSAKDKNHNLEIFYWKDEKHLEVDFIVKNKNSVKQLIQVCWDLNDLKTKERELKSLIKASRELKCDNLLVITSDYEAEEKIYAKGTSKTKKINSVKSRKAGISQDTKLFNKVKFIPLWKWLLDLKKEPKV